MVLPPDLHMHTPLCRHATGEPAEYARRAVEGGLAEIGFSDHSPMRQDDFDDWRMRFDQLDEYVEKVRRARKEFPQLTIRLALEVDYLPGQEDWIRELAAKHTWDYLIGSVHYVSEAWAIDNPHMISEWNNRDAFEVWTAYFDRLTRAAETGLFQILGHADLPKKFGHRPTTDCTPLHERFLRAAKRHNCAIELNTAGLRKDCREIYPSREILSLAHTIGVPITFGSDAHAPGEVGPRICGSGETGGVSRLHSRLHLSGEAANRLSALAPAELRKPFPIAAILTGSAGRGPTSKKQKPPGWRMASAVKN